MGTVRQKKAAKNTNKNTRRTADRHRKRVTIHVNLIALLSIKCHFNILV